MTSSDNILLIDDPDVYTSLVKEHSLNTKNRVFIFSATWCGPCQTYKKMWQSEAAKNPTVYFIYVNVDECPDLAEEHGVTNGIPYTTIVSSKGKRMLSFGGPDIKKLRSGIEILLE